MTELKPIEPKGPTPTDTRNHAIRTASIDMAIRSNCGQCYDTENRVVHDAQEIVKAAAMFEEYINGKVKTDTPKIPETPKKEGW